jgi:hypothetical protein
VEGGEVSAYCGSRVLVVEGKGKMDLIRWLNDLFRPRQKRWKRRRGDRGNPSLKRTCEVFQNTRLMNGICGVPSALSRTPDKSSQRFLFRRAVEGE